MVSTIIPSVQDLNDSAGFNFIYIFFIGPNAEPTEINFPVQLPPAGRNYKVTDLRRMITNCVTMGREGMHTFFLCMY